MIPNLRDVGETVNILYGSPLMKEGVFFRGGTVNKLFDSSELPGVDCILNLRNEEDRVFAGVKQIHIPRTYTNEVYDTRSGGVRNWLNCAVSSVAKDEAFPLLVHCTSGKDRTGVFVALLLLLIGIEKRIVVEDYLISEGHTDVVLINQAISGFGIYP